MIMLNEKALEAALAVEVLTTRRDHMKRAIAAYLSDLLPEDAAELVERLRRPWGGTPNSRAERDAERAEAASLIQSQAARIAVLDGGLSEFADPANWVVNGRFDPNSGNFDATTFARALLNGERKG